MPSTYSFSFFTMDPGNPPAPNTVLNPTTLTVIDQNDNGSIGTSQGDTVGGFAVTNVWVDDTVTVRVDGQDVQMTGVTFYRSGAPAVFMPTDGTILTGSSFQSSTFVVTSTEYSLPPVPCFTAGTMIFTAQGARPVETLEPGDLILTRDSGMRPLRWIAQTTVCGLDRFAPSWVMAGTVGNTRQVLVSPKLRML
ncbi:MAG: Hint domain-containing protein, partial [Paracoccaceae bacterium]|nr:Hint domain-containing protein [Paracoccaceae bacterium]